MRFVMMLVVAAAVGMLPAAVHAQDSRSELARRDLLERAEQARVSGDHAMALTLATRAAQIHQTPSLRLMLAQEHRVVGHLVEALDNATACAREAEADATLRNRARLVEVCRTLAAEVEPSIGHLTVRVTPASAAGLHVRVGDDELPAALIGVASPEMPGQVRVRVEATGFRTASQEVAITAGREAQVDVALEADRASPSAVMGDRATITGASDPGRSGSRGPGAAPWVLVAGGGAAAIAGGVMWYLANDQRLMRNDAADVGQRDPAVSADSAFRTYAYVGDALVGVGVVGIVGGVLWGVLGRRRAETRIAVAPVAGGAMVGVGGAL